MNRPPVLQRLLSGPVWVKLALGFAVAVMVPLALFYLAIQPGLRELGLSNIEAFISENGERQRLAIVNAVEQAQGNLERFSSNETYARRLTAFLLRDSSLLRNSPVPGADAESISALLDDRLLNRSTTLFNNIRLLDRSGQLIAYAALDTPPAEVIALDQSNSAAYRDAVNEDLMARGRNQILSVSTRDETAVIEVIDILRWRDDSAIGYLVGEIDPARAFYDSLTFEGTGFPAHTFLLSTNRVLISPPETRADALAALDSPAVERALSGEIGLGVFQTVPDTEGAMVYFAPIADTPLVLIAEAPVGPTLARIQNLFDTRLLPAGAITVALVAVLILAFNGLVTLPLTRLRHVVEGIGDGDFERPIRDADRDDEVGLLAVSIAAMREQVQSLIHDLEARIALQTRDIGTTQEISRFAATQRDLQTLMEKVVNLIVERFPAIYHAQIFLLDSEGQWALLRASTGEAGRELLARGHRLATGSVSVIGQVTEQGRVVLASDTSESQVHRRNPLLPDTRAELAIPLRVGDRIIGALDVQSRQRDAFNDDLIAVLQTMADQIAIAIENARLYQESVQRLGEIERATREAIRAAWRETLRDYRQAGLSALAGHEPIDLPDLRAEAIRSGQIAVGEVTSRDTIPVAVPVQLRGEILGAIEWEIPAADLDDNRLQLAQELANRLAISLDNARLFEDSRRATERERVVNTIAARLTAQTTINDILQTAVREVGQALRAPQIRLRLHESAVVDGTATDKAMGSPANGNGNGHGDLP